MSLALASSFTGTFSIIVGLMIIGMWFFLLLTDQVPERQGVKRSGITLHLGAEFATAALLIISGAGLLFSNWWAFTLAPVSLGMLLYTIIASAGKYADDKNYPIVGMFIAIGILTVVAIIALYARAE